MDKKEYHRNYYYKRDPEKLKRYRKKYQHKQKVKKQQERWRRAHGVKPRVRKTDLSQMSYQTRWWYNNPDKVKKYRQKYYSKNKDRILEKMNFEYRAKKLHEFADNVLNIPEDNNNYG